MKIHLISHVSSTILGKHIRPFPLVKIDGEEEFEVKEILDTLVSCGCLEYLIHLHGYDLNAHTWEHAFNITNASQ
jgi:hypothetical protein